MGGAEGLREAGPAAPGPAAPLPTRLPASAPGRARARARGGALGAVRPAQPSRGSPGDGSRQWRLRPPSELGWTDGRTAGRAAPLLPAPTPGSQWPPFRAALGPLAPPGRCPPWPLCREHTRPSSSAWFTETRPSGVGCRFLQEAHRAATSSHTDSCVTACPGGPVPPRNGLPSRAPTPPRSRRAGPQLRGPPRGPEAALGGLLCFLPGRGPAGSPSRPGPRLCPAPLAWAGWVRPGGRASTGGWAAVSRGPAAAPPRPQPARRR